MEVNEVVEDYKSSLADLAINSKPLINMLTMLAEENKEHAEDLVKVIEAHILKVSSSKKLPCLYLIDSIIKNIQKGPYLKLFMPNIVNVFCAVFEKVDEKTRQAMFKLRSTWNPLLPKAKLYALDIRVVQIDPAWPVQAKPVTDKPSSIHVNPKFIKKEDGKVSTPTPVSVPSVTSTEQKIESTTPPVLPKPAETVVNQVTEDEALLRAQLLEKQRELLYLQQKQMDLELEQARKKLAESAVFNQRPIEPTPPVVVPQPAAQPIQAPAVQAPPTTQAPSTQAPPTQAPPTQAPALSRDPRLAAKSRDPRLKAMESDKARTSSPLTLQPTPEPKAVVEETEKEQKEVVAKDEKEKSSKTSPKSSSKSTSRSSSSSSKRSSKSDKKDDKSDKSDKSVKKDDKSDKKSPTSKKSSSSSSKSSDKDKKSRSSSRSKSDSRSRSSHRRHKSPEKRSRDRSTRSKSPEKRSRDRSTRSKSQEKSEDKDKDERRMKERRNYRSHRSASPDGDSNDSVSKRQRLNDGDDKEEVKSPPRQRHFAIRSRQVEGPGRSIRAKRVYTEAKSIEEHERLASKLIEEKKNKGSGDRLEDQDERRKHDHEDGPPSKKAKEGVSDELLGLFGTQDVDYRQKPSLKLPPIPKLSPNSRQSGSMDTSSPVPVPTTPQSASWARFKADRPEEFPFSQPRSVESPATPGNRPFMLQEANQWLEQADLQLKEGRISQSTHEDIIKQLAQLYRLQQKKEEVQLEARNLQEPMPEEEFNARYQPDPSLQEPRLPEPQVPEPRVSEPQQPLVKRPLLPSPIRKPGPLLPNPPMAHRIPGAHGPGLLELPTALGMPQPTKVPLLPPPPLPPLALNPRDPRKPKVALLETPKPVPILPPPPVPLGPEELEPHNLLDPNNLGYDTTRFYVPQHDPRWMMKVRAMHPVKGRNIRGGGGSFSDYEVIFNDRSWSVPIDGRFRQVKLPYKDSGRVKVLVDLKRRELYIDDVCHYRLNQPKRTVVVRGYDLEVGFQGCKRRLWIDGFQFDIRDDAPPEPILIDGSTHEIAINGLTKRVIIDGHDICPCDPSEPQRAMIAFKEHEFLFAPPPREILIDGKLCSIEFAGDFPAVNMSGKLHGICFDGPPRDIVINGQAWSVAMDRPRKIHIGQRPYHIGFGGPGYELIIDDEWYELKFGGEEKVITVGNKKVALQLLGSPPEVKILGQLVMEDQLEEAIERASVEDEVKQKLEDEKKEDSNTPVMPAQPVDKENMPETVMPQGLQQQMRGGRGGFVPRGRRFNNRGRPWLPPDEYHRLRRQGFFRHQGGFDDTPAPPPTNASAPAAAAAPMDMDSILSRLVQAGILKKPAAGGTEASAADSPVPKAKNTPEIIPDLSDFSEGLKGKYQSMVGSLYSGIQCTSCGQRFQEGHKDKYQQHLDWHFRQNTRGSQPDSKVANYRRWYSELQDWVQFTELADLEGSNKSQSNFFERMLMSVNVNQAAGQGKEAVISCPVAKADDGENDDLCEMCHEPFEQFWEEEDESWHLKDAVRVNGKTYHPICYEDFKEQSVLETPEPEEETTAEKVKSTEETQPTEATTVKPAEIPVEKELDPITNPVAYIEALTRKSLAAKAQQATTETPQANKDSQPVDTSQSKDTQNHESPMDTSETNVPQAQPQTQSQTQRTVTPPPVAQESAMVPETSEDVDMPELEKEPEQSETVTSSSSEVESAVELIVVKPERMDTALEAQHSEKERVTELRNEATETTETPETSEAVPMEVMEVTRHAEDMAPRGPTPPIVIKPEQGVSEESQESEETPRDESAVLEENLLPEDSIPEESLVQKESLPKESVPDELPVAKESAPPTPVSIPSPVPPPRRDPGLERIMAEHDVLMSPAETYSDIDDDAIIRAQFTDLEEEEDREEERVREGILREAESRSSTPRLVDEDEELLNAQVRYKLSPSKIQITVSRKIMPVIADLSSPTVTPEASPSRSPVPARSPRHSPTPPPASSPQKETVTEDEKKEEEDKEVKEVMAKAEEEDGGCTPVRDEDRDEAATPTLDEPAVYDDPPTPLADETPAETFDPWSLIPLEEDDDDDIAPFIPPPSSTINKDEPPPPGEEPLAPPVSNVAAPVVVPPTVIPTPTPTLTPTPAPTPTVPPQMMMYPQYPAGIPMYPQTNPQAYNYMPQTAGFYLPQQPIPQGPQAPTMGGDTMASTMGNMASTMANMSSDGAQSIQSLSTVTGHRPHNQYHHRSGHHHHQYHGNDSTSASYTDSASYRSGSHRRYDDEDEDGADRRYRRRGNSRERDDRRPRTDGRRW